MSILRRTNGQYVHFCPACRTVHMLGATWTFNGDMVKPTFSPSFRHASVHANPHHPTRVCHYTITDGLMAYATDSTHPLAGQTIPMPDHDWSTWGPEEQ